MYSPCYLKFPAFPLKYFLKRRNFVSYTSRLSKKRIILSIIIFCLIPVISSGLNIFVENTTLSYMFSINLCGTILIIYDWNLFGIHYNRCKANPKDTILYTLIGIILFALWFYSNEIFFHAGIVRSDPNTLLQYGFAAGAILIAYSFMLSCIINISFKCLTDHMDIRSRELLIILVSGLLFGLLYTIVFLPFFGLELDLAMFVLRYFFNIIMISILSYLYNQSSSFIPGIISLGIILFALQFIQ